MSSVLVLTLCLSIWMRVSNSLQKLSLKAVGSLGAAHFSLSSQTQFNSQLTQEMIPLSHTTGFNSSQLPISARNSREAGFYTFNFPVRALQSKYERWELRSEELLGADSSALHRSTTFFSCSTYMLTTGRKKVHSSASVCSVITTRDFNPHEEQYSHPLQEQQRVHEITKKKNHQGHIRQKHLFD